MAVLMIMLVVFILGYIAIALEEPLKINKAASALFIGVIIWVIYILGIPGVLNAGFSPHWEEFKKSLILADYMKKFPDAGILQQMKYFIVDFELVSHLGTLSQILFFLLGAMTIVETIKVHNGFRVITEKITTTNKVKLLWILSLITFFLSTVLDNMTTTIVMIALLRDLISDKKTRWYFASIIIIAANAGGAFSPIGDITTIMLWIGGQVTELDIIAMVFLPSLFSLVVPLIFLSFFTKGEVEKPQKPEGETGRGRYSTFLLITGIAGLVFVPVFKTFTGLPPYMGMLLSLSVIWMVTEFVHRKDSPEDQEKYSVIHVLRNVDIGSILFYLGILSAVAALESAGHLNIMAGFLNKNMHNIYAINGTIGILSSIIDNVPLTAAAMGMYPVMTPSLVAASADPAFMQHFVQNGAFWELLAYASGTGGSILIIGSAAGVVAMALEKIDFIWYMKKISWIALLGYVSGICVYWLQNELIFHH